MGAESEPKGSKRDPKGCQGEPKGAEREPKGSKIIFETGKDVIPATVKEQRLFHLKWRNKNESEEVEYDDAAFQWSIEPNLEKQ